MPTRPDKRKQSFRRQWENLITKAQAVSPTYHADIFLLILRAGKWHSRVFRHTSICGGDITAVPPGNARRLKEGFRRQRESLVRRAHHISRTAHADVFVYATRKGRWYADEYLHVSFYPHRGTNGHLMKRATEKNSRPTF